MTEVKPGSHIQQLEKELAEAKARIKRLRNLLDESIANTDRTIDTAEHHERKSSMLLWLLQIIIFLNAAYFTCILLGRYK